MASRSRAEYGSVEELPNIHHFKEWQQGVVRPCLFVDRNHRRAVEAYPHDLPPGKKTSSSFLYNPTRSIYEQLGFTYEPARARATA